jgi:hypothetical protein
MSLYTILAQEPGPHSLLTYSTDHTKCVLEDFGQPAMSQPLAPRPSNGGGSSPILSSSQRPRKISTACGACKQRKTRVGLSIPYRKCDSALTLVQCTGGQPCEACSTRRSSCIYDATSDQRRKIANQRNVQELQDAQHDLQNHRQLLGGIIATIRAGDMLANQELVRVIRSNVDLSQLAAHVRNECRANLSIQRAFESIHFLIDDPKELPSAGQILGSAAPPSVDGIPPGRTLSGHSSHSTNSETSSGITTGNSTSSLNLIPR